MRATGESSRAGAFPAAVIVYFAIIPGKRTRLIWIFCIKMLHGALVEGEPGVARIERW
jgi:hypothetical protein